MSYSYLSSSKIPSVLKCPTSKSYANRALILASLKPGNVVLKDMPLAKDVSDLIEMLKYLGLELIQENKIVTIKNSFPECEKQAHSAILLPGSEGGTTVRFIASFLALGKNEYHIPLEGRLAERPIKPLIDFISDNGGFAEISNKILKIKGPIKISGEKIFINCSESTQFASSVLHLQMKESFELNYENLKVSKSYLLMTEKVLKDLREDNEYIIPPDYSSLGYIIAWAVLNQDILITNVLNNDLYQADSYLLKVLDRIGSKFEFTSKGLQIYKSENLKTFDVDGSKCIDLVPTLIYLASFIKGKSSISNVSFLRHKESDRLEEMMKILNYFNVSYSYDEKVDTLFVGDISKKVENVKIETAFDHRMVMVAGLFCKSLGGGEVAPKDCISKSFPDFFTLFR